ncbi:arginase [Purpureocillium lavendulum]|uniref:Arginase n=1 Tax=Purpureocillium lavendulum TaxID=1247861 RepID=A0AB34FPV1_9HYPO|nr:arginase [Purpureocillium lavendulum]
MAQTTRGEINLSSAPSTTFSVPESSPDFDPLEPDVDGTGDTSPSIDYAGKRARTGWVWEHGFDIENTNSGHRYWLCKFQANSHMEEVHHVCKGGPMLPQRKKQRTLLDMVDLDTHQPKDQALMNAFISSFDPLRFQHLLIRWVAAIVDSGSVPTHSTIRDWIVRSFNRNFRTFLLGLPRIEGRHCGENLADRVSEILHEYGFEDRVGYFVTDNAESNDTCLEDLGPDKEIQDEVKLWRSKGPIGKLHNTVHWVERSGQRIERLHKPQSIENTALGLEDKTTYDVVMDNATRWNSSEAMMEREWSQYVARRTQNGAKPMPKKCRKKPTIVDDRMAAEDWSVIAEYLAILKPLKIATKRLEGRPREGKSGAIWEVLLTMEWLLKHLEEAKLQHERDEEPYLRIGCNLGWMKLDQYYALTEDSPAYLASLVLHPAFRWSTVESQWSDHPDWLTRGRTAVQELWEEYRSLPIEQDTIPEQPTVSRMTTDLDDFMASIRKLGAQPAPSSLVLYSRLHLILRNRFYLKLVLGMIITNAIILHVPIIVLMFGANSPQARIFEFPYSVYEKIQVTIFSLQEIFISIIYLKACASFFRVQDALHGGSARQIRNHLWLVNVVAILLDIPILVLEYANLYVYQTAYKALVYSIKLKLEFNILNRLIEVTKNRDHGSSSHKGLGTKDGAPIHMESLKGVNGNHGTLSTSQAYAYSSGDGRRSMGKSRSDNEVLMTTEIVVHRLKRMDEDSDDADRKSMTGDGSQRGTRRAIDASSKTSSEINLTTREY